MVRDPQFGPLVPGMVRGPHGPRFNFGPVLDFFHWLALLKKCPSCQIQHFASLNLAPGYFPRHQQIHNTNDMVYLSSLNSALGIFRKFCQPNRQFRILIFGAGVERKCQTKPSCLRKFWKLLKLSAYALFTEESDLQK